MNSNACVRTAYNSACAPRRSPLASSSPANLPSRAPSSRAATCAAVHAPRRAPRCARASTCAPLRERALALSPSAPSLRAAQVLARSLVLWDEVRASEAWLMRQLPPIVRAAFDDPAADVGTARDGGGTSPNARARTVDRVALRMAHVHAVAGACSAIGLRYAGSAHRGAQALLAAHVKRFHALRASAGASAGAIAGTRGVTAVTAAELPTIECCLGSALLALACVMAGARAEQRAARGAKQRARRPAVFGLVTTPHHPAHAG